MINYTEKGHGLHEAIASAGYVLREENGTWTSSNDAAVQTIIDGPATVAGRCFSVGATAVLAVGLIQVLGDPRAAGPSRIIPLDGSGGGAFR